jgi:putative addiction module component (TIGR02574 family)
MGTIPQKILDDALKLTAEQRAALASSLIASLEGETVDEDAEAAWAVEISKRIEQIDGDQIRLIPWPEVRRDILSRIHGRAGS